MILILNFGLIVTLLMLDRNYRVFQRAAATRAKIIERKINLELTEVIAQRYNITDVPDFITGFYMAFIIIVLGLGFAVLSLTFWFWLLVAGLISFGIIYWINYSAVAFVKLKFPFGEIDWTLYPLQCNVGEQVEITVSNLGSDPIKFDENTTMWEIHEESDDSLVDSGGTGNRDIIINKNDSFTWLWAPKNEGVYRVHRLTLDPKTGEPGNLKKLLRKFRVRK